MIETIDSPVVNMNKQFLIDTSVPETSRTYKAVAHEELMNITLESIDKCGFTLIKEVYTSSREGQRANGKYHLSYGNDNEMGLMIAWQNSYDKKLSLKFGIGTVVYICENGCICADMGRFKSKHVGDVQQITPHTLQEYICRAGDTFDKMIVERQKMKEIEITKKATAELLGRLFIEDAIITSTQLNIIKNQLERPSYDYGAEGTVWELMNHCTLAQKEAKPELWMDQSINLHRFYTKEFNIN